MRKERKKKIRKKHKQKDKNLKRYLLIQVVNILTIFHIPFVLRIKKDI